MNNPRIILWGLFGTLAFLTWTQWQLENGPETVSAPVQNTEVAELASQPPPIDSLPAPIAEKTNADDPLPAVPAQEAVAGAGTIKIETDVLRLEISLLGGTLVEAELKKYPVNKDTPDIPVQLFNQNPATHYVLESGLIDAEKGGPLHDALLTSDASSYVLAEGADSLQVPLHWKSPNGIVVTKTFTLKRGQYNIDLNYQVNNTGNTDWYGLSYLRISRLYKPAERSMFNVDSYSFVGPVYYDTEKYEKIDPEDLADEPLDVTVAGGWIASLQHHFVSAAVPATGEQYRYDASFSNGIIVVRASGTEWLHVGPGSQGSFAAKLFVGPKNQQGLSDTAEGLDLTVDYGMLSILARPLFWLLGKVHSFVGNWGWSIILVTLLIKLAFYKLTEASGRSMAKMRKLQPRLKALQERYKDDRQQLSQQMMELYKREKVNPAAGCLPMLIQIPFFIAFYWVLLESVEMRQAPFALWITDLSSRDPFFVLPLLMGGAMFLQQKLNPAPPDPIQAKVMMFLPVMFTVFFAFFPSGLVLYWLTNSVLSVLQQWNINRRMHAD